MFTLNSIKANEKKVAKYSATQLKYTKVLHVPGISLNIFVQDTRKVHLPNGSKATLQLCMSTNADYINAHGRIYALAGEKFVSMTHKEQLAHLLYALDRMSNNPYTSMDEEHEISDMWMNLIHSLGIVIPTSDMGYDSDDADDVITDNTAKIYRIMAECFGEATARKVIKSTFNEIMRTNQLAAKAAAKQVKKDKRGYKAKDFKAAVKVSKQEYKNVVKADAKETKAEKKAAKESKKQTIKETASEKAKEVQDEVAAAAATIKDKIEEVVEPKTETAPEGNPA